MPVSVHCCGQPITFGLFQCGYYYGNQNSFIYGLYFAFYHYTHRHDADSSFCDSEGRSAFHWSCKSPDTKCLKLLCKHSKEGVADKVDGEGLSALHWAVMCNNDAHIRLLLSSTDANANITDREGRTALNYAVLNYSPHCIKVTLIYLSLTNTAFPIF